MTLEAHLDEILKSLLCGAFEKSITTEQLIGSIDLTLLDELASSEALSLLRSQAHINPIAAICVFPKHLSVYKSLDNLSLATVINFPNGTDNINECLEQIKMAKTLGANEIDYVLPYQEYLAGNKKQALAQCSEIVQLCKEHRLTLKIIMETGSFPDMQSIYQASMELIKIGCDFLKTSTGKITQGATLSAVFAILSAIKDSGSTCGIKISGGVKTPYEALGYASLSELIIGKRINPDWFRIGASSLLGELLKTELKINS